MIKQILISKNPSCIYRVRKDVERKWTKNARHAANMGTKIRTG